MKRTLTLIASALVCASALAQGTLADYQRAYGIRSAYAGKTTNIVGNNVQLTADESQVIYSVTTKNSNAKGYSVKYSITGKYVKTCLKTPKQKRCIGKTTLD